MNKLKTMAVRFPAAVLVGAAASPADASLSASVSLSATDLNRGIRRAAAGAGAHNAASCFSIRFRRSASRPSCLVARYVGRFPGTSGFSPSALRSDGRGQCEKCARH